MKPKEARSKVIDGILASRTDCKECKPVYEKYQKIFFKKTKEKFKQEHPEVARYAKAAAYLAKHPDDKDSTQKELQEEQETLLEEIAALKTPLIEVQADLKKSLVAPAENFVKMMHVTDCFTASNTFKSIPP